VQNKYYIDIQDISTLLGLTPLNVYRGFTSGLSSPRLKEIVPSARGHIFDVSKLIQFV